MCEENLWGKRFFVAKRIVSPVSLSKKAIRMAKELSLNSPCAPERERNDRPVDKQARHEGPQKAARSSETSSARSSTVLRRLRFTKKGSRSLSAKEQLPFDIS